jgi:hypothetical protein
MEGDRLKQLIKQGSIIGMGDILIPVAYIELRPHSLFWCSTEDGPCGGPHVLKFTRMTEEKNQANFYAGDSLVGTISPFDEWMELGDAVLAYQTTWKVWCANTKKKAAAESYWHTLGQSMK